MRICLAFFLVYLTSCNGQEMKVPPTKCVVLNNKGTEYVMKYTNNDKSGILKAIDLFNQAINCDSTYLVAYLNLAGAYDVNQDYKKELSVFNKALILAHNNALIITQKAEVFEKMSLLDSAKSDYNLAKQGFIDSLSAHPNDVNLIGGFVLLTALTKGKEAALKELDRRIKLNPELRSKMISYYYFYQHFDKRAYFYHLTQ